MRIFILLLAVNFTAALAQKPDGKEILLKIDKNMSSETRVFTSKMIIHGKRSIRTVESKSWVAGEKKSYTEYLFPAREEGTTSTEKTWIDSALDRGGS